MAPGLHEVLSHDAPALTFSNSAHACVVEIDPATGALEILRYVAAEDCGTLIIPMVVAGQSHGLGTHGALSEPAALGPLQTAGQLGQCGFYKVLVGRAGGAVSARNGAEGEHTAAIRVMGPERARGAE